MRQSSDHTVAAAALSDQELLHPGELIAIVDDFSDIVNLLQLYLQQRGFPSVSAASAQALRQHLKSKDIALALLDIGLPDADGMALLPHLKQEYPDTAIIMLTGVTDLQIALQCLRHGADDYLTKPVRFPQLMKTMRRVLEKRRLHLRHRECQHHVEQGRRRIQRAHDLAIRMSRSYLSLVRMDQLAQAILVGVTAQEGLGFNRAFLALYNADGQRLIGRYALGAASKERGYRIWEAMQQQNMGLDVLLSQVETHHFQADQEIQLLVKRIEVDATDSEHIALKALAFKRPLHVQQGFAEGHAAPTALIELLQEDAFVIAPLYSSTRALGFILADHFISGKAISAEELHALESFASQASLAIEHCLLYQNMQEKISELEGVTRELKNNKDRLVSAERYSALGHMTAQLAHSIKNPLTAIGGTARLLGRRMNQQDLRHFIDLMITESEKVERTLGDLARFADQSKPVYSETSLLALVRNTVLLHQDALRKGRIQVSFHFPAEEERLVSLDLGLMEEVVGHLLRNAIEAMPLGGELIIGLEWGEAEVILSFRDSGQGIKNKYLSQVTDPFFTTKTMGAGLGLALVGRIVKDHGGLLTLINRREGGIEANIRLPLSH